MLDIWDRSGFEALLGGPEDEDRLGSGPPTYRVPGLHLQTASAASLVLFGKDREIMWRAP